MKQLEANKDDVESTNTPIIRGDLVMRAALNRQSKLHSKCNGSWIVYDLTNAKAYQLASGNGHVIYSLVNVARIRKLNVEERKNWANGDFREASDRLKRYDTRSKEQWETRGLDVRLKEATTEFLETQERSEIVSLGILQLLLQKGRLGLLIDGQELQGKHLL